MAAPANDVSKNKTNPAPSFPIGGQMYHVDQSKNVGSMTFKCLGRGEVLGVTAGFGDVRDLRCFVCLESEVNVLCS